MYKVYCLDDGREYYFDTNSALEAMKKIIYTLNLPKFDVEVQVINIGDRILTITHNDKTYSCLMKEVKEW